MSNFREDICKFAQLVVKELSNCQFTNFAVDGVPVETKDAMLTQYRFLDGNKNRAGIIDNGNNAKNHM